MDYLKADFKNTTDEGLYFDSEQFMKTPHKAGKFLIDEEKGLFNRKHEGYQGDLLEEKYSDASHIGWETDKMGKYNKAFDYLTGDPDDETMFNQQDFDDGFDRPLIGPTLDPDDPNSYNYSKEYLESSKHNPNIYFEKGDNSNINPNFMGDGRFSKRIPKPNDPNDFTNPQNVINANDKLRKS